MPDTFIKIASVTVGSGGAASIDFTSIPATYTDLLIYTSSKNTSAGAVSDMYLTFNNSGGTAYSERTLFGTGSSALSESFTSQAFIPRAGYSTGTAFTTGAFSNNLYYIPNYAGSNNKTLSIDSVMEDNGTGSYMGLFAGLWANTAAITSVKLTPYATIGNFAQYSTAILYGIKNS